MTDLIEVRAARSNDSDKIVDFIRSDWKEDHIFVKDPSFFQYFYKRENQLCFYLGVKKSTHEIVGVLGYIPYNDSNKQEDIFLSLWKARQINEAPSLGLSLLNLLQKELSPKRIHCLGINKKTLNIYKFLGYHVDKMKHYYLLNPEVEDFKIASVKIGKNSSILKNKNKSSVQITNVLDFNRYEKSIQQLISHSPVPVKSKEYLLYRYLEHPKFLYNLELVFCADVAIGLIITRRLYLMERSVLRVIDFIGEDQKFLDCLDSISSFTDKDQEYIDFYCANISEELLNKSRFKMKNSKEDIVIPNFFSPFVNSNIDIHYFSSEKSGFRFFLGDGDQDRPNSIEGESREG